MKGEKVLIELHLLLLLCLRGIYLVLTSLGKHKAASESGKPPKSKVQSIIEQQEGSIKVRSLLQSLGQPSTSATEFGISQSLWDVGINGLEFVFLDTLAEEDDHTGSSHISVIPDFLLIWKS